MRADKYHRGVPTDHWKPYKFRDPKIAAIAAVAVALGATMSVNFITFSLTNGTWTAPVALVPGTVIVTVVGGSGGTGGGGGNPPATAAKGALITATVPTSPGDVLTVTVGKKGGGPTGGVGFHNGGAGGTSHAGGTSTSGGGGGSSAVQRSGLLLAESAGGGGAGDNAGNLPGLGVGGAGGTPTGGNGTGNLSADNPGSGATISADGAGGTVPPLGNETAGSPGSSGVGGAGGNGRNPGAMGSGGGGGGRKGGGGGGGAANLSGGFCGTGGGGGSSYVDPSLLSVSETSSTSASDGFVTIQWNTYDAPPAPTLGTPANASFVDSNASGVVFSATYNGPDALAKVALRVSKDGGAYGYWNGTNFTSSTPVWNSGGTITGIGATVGQGFAVTIPAAVLADGHNYSWSCAVQDATAGLQGSFASDFIFTAAAAPTINSLSPVTSAVTVTPIVIWTETLGGGLSQLSYRYMIYTAASTPGAPGAQYDSGVVTSAATSFALPSSAGLVNGLTYFGYLQIVETGPNASQWAEATFTVALDGPAQPTIIVAQIADPTTAMPEPRITVLENDNLIPGIDSTFETGTIGSFTATNATLSNSTTWSADGSASLQASSTASGAVAVTEGTTSPCSAGQIVTAMATVQQPSLTQTVSLSVRFLDASNATISTVTIASVAASSAGVSLSGQSSAAPTGTASCLLVFTYTATGATQLTRFDKLAIFLGTVSTWSAGGFVGIATAGVQASYDGGTTWADLRSGSAVALANQTGSVIDSESPFNIILSYRARIVAVVGGQTLTSSWSAVSTIEIASLQWWIIDPVTPSNAMALIRVDSGGGTTPPGSTAAIVINKNVRQGIFRGFGSSVANVVYGDTWADEFDITLFFDSEASWQTFDGIRNRKTTVLLKSDMTGKRYYMALGGDRPASIVSESGRQSNPRRGLTIHCTPVAVP